MRRGFIIGLSCLVVVSAGSAMERNTFQDSQGSLPPQRSSVLSSDDFEETIDVQVFEALKRQDHRCQDSTFQRFPPYHFGCQNPQNATHLYNFYSHETEKKPSRRHKRTSSQMLTGDNPPPPGFSLPTSLDLLPVLPLAFQQIGASHPKLFEPGLCQFFNPANRAGENSSSLPNKPVSDLMPLDLSASSTVTSSSVSFIIPDGEIRVSQTVTVVDEETQDGEEGKHQQSGLPDSLLPASLVQIIPAGSESVAELESFQAQWNQYLENFTFFE